jgi:hypothetical protein
MLLVVAENVTLFWLDTPKNAVPVGTVAIAIVRVTHPSAWPTLLNAIRTDVLRRWVQLLVCPGAS